MANNKITALDLAPFVGLPCAIYSGGELVSSHYIEGVDVYLNKVIAERVNYEPDRIKPILKDLSLLSVDDTAHISCNIMGYNKESKKKYQKWNKNDLNDIKEYGMIQFHSSDSIFMPEIMKYLTRKGFNLGLIPEGTFLIQQKNGSIVDCENNVISKIHGSYKKINRKSK